MNDSRGVIRKVQSTTEAAERANGSRTHDDMCIGYFDQRHDDWNHQVQVILQLCTKDFESM